MIGKSKTTQKVLLQFRCAVCYQSSVIEKCKQHESMSYFTGEWEWGWAHKVNWKGPITKGTSLCVEPTITFIITNQ